eukprot:snap_masked-scaffold_3-processed-gene-0.31-mRNA-1 protein AED:1.00 eAED:1.00 QI:0/0/0/0/1/1/2/0/67
MVNTSSPASLKENLSLEQNLKQMMEESFCVLLKLKTGKCKNLLVRVNQKAIALPIQSKMETQVLSIS